MTDKLNLVSANTDLPVRSIRQWLSDNNIDEIEAVISEICPHWWEFLLVLAPGMCQELSVYLRTFRQRRLCESFCEILMSKSLSSTTQERSSTSTPYATRPRTVPAARTRSRSRKKGERYWAWRGRHLVLEPLPWLSLRFRKRDVWLFVVEGTATGMGLEGTLFGPAGERKIPELRRR